MMMMIDDNVNNNDYDDYDNVENYADDTLNDNDYDQNCYDDDEEEEEDDFVTVPTHPA